MQLLSDWQGAGALRLGQLRMKGHPLYANEACVGHAAARSGKQVINLGRVGGVHLKAAHPVNFRFTPGSS